tara:strand:+ start:94536 stop:95759 length:1224 start_codon:yes stop_codon:yes gene_type:complete
MFSNLKATKIIVLIGLLLVIIFKINFSDLLLNECYTNQPSYHSGDEVTLYYSSQRVFPFNINIPIIDINNKEVFSINIPFGQETTNENEVLTEGFQYTTNRTFIIPENIKSGIYFINGKHPLIVKQPSTNKITVVYPFMNNLIYQPYQHQAVFDVKAATTSFLRTVYEDNYTKGLKKLFTEIDANYITDIDLEDNTNFKNQQLLIIYGKATYFTSKMKQNIDDFVENGGNLLIISSYYQNNICWYNSITSKVTLIHPESNVIQSWQGYLAKNNDSTTTLTPLTYAYGGFTDKSGNLIINHANHPILKGVAKINVETYLNISLPTNWENGKPIIDTSKMKVVDAKIIAYNKAKYYDNKGVKGIFIFQPTKTSGEIISLVSEDWCLKKNYGENKEIQLITKNAIDYLSK